MANAEPRYACLWQARVDEDAEPAVFWLPGVSLPIIIPEGGTVVLKVRDSVFTAERVEHD